ncbi:HERC4 [Symbiodinium microadriaticum]|nr:HERC4 [Symbiodinium microadriaticum]
MGGKGWKSQRPGKGGQSWSYWPGAYSPTRRYQDRYREKWEEPRAPHLAFPRYDEQKIDMAQPQNQVVVVSETRTEGPSTRGFLGEVQAMVNSTRKCEHRLKNLENSRAQKLAQWDKYTKDLQKSFKAEKERHLRAVQKLEEDIQQARAACEQSEEILRDMAFQQRRSGGSMELEEEDPLWERLMRECDELEPTADEEAFLRPSKESYAEVTAAAPFVASPGTSRTRSHAAATPPQMKERDGSDRRPIKAKTAPLAPDLGGMSLETKLEKKRHSALAMAVMREAEHGAPRPDELHGPTGPVESTERIGMPVQAEPPPPTAHGGPPHIIEDDDNPMEEELVFQATLPEGDLLELHFMYAPGGAPDGGYSPGPFFPGELFYLCPAFFVHLLLLLFLVLLRICAEIKAALHALELRFAFHVLPTIPQLGPDFASFVATPAWAQDAGKQVIVYDFQDLGGPVYSSIVWTRVTFGDCEAEARRHNITNWSVYVQGCSQQLEAGASFLAFPGGVVQFRPEGQPAFWRSPLPSRLDRHIDWSADPELPDYGTEWPLFVTYHDLHVLFSTKRYPEVPILAFLADRIERGPGDFLIIAPPGNILQNIDFHGVSCRDALAIYPLSPNTERDAIVVFLDARTTGTVLAKWTDSPKSIGKHCELEWFGHGLSFLDWSHDSITQLESAQALGHPGDRPADKGILTAKVLSEPTSDRSALRGAVAALRYFAPRIGQGWRYTPSPDAVFVTSDSDTEDSQSEQGEEYTLMHFAVLTPGFQAAHFAIRLVLPAMPQEAIAQVQRQRNPNEVHDFPCLVPVSPQPCPGNGIVIAIPAWCAAEHHPSKFLCFDTSLIDGRLYTTACPAYVSKRHLLRLADLPVDGDVDVHVGCDPIPIAWEGQLHVAHGDTFVFVPRGAIVPTLRTLDREMLSRRAWSNALLIPRASDEGRYALVHQDESILFFSHFEQPTTYRSQIANCIGISQLLLRIFPSSPRISNATLQGAGGHTGDAPAGSGANPEADSPSFSPTAPPGETVGARQQAEAEAAPLYRTCPFLILGQGYTAERVEVRLPLEVDLMQALRLVSAARLPQDVAKLPCIQAVFPQPQGSHAICVATPAWEQHGAVVIFDCRSIDGRLFAIHLIGRTTRSGLLIAAGIAEDADVQVFIGNQPWPLVEGPSVDLVPGELILITPAGAPHHIVASLQDMLASPGDWTTRPDPAPWIRDHIYPFARILGDDDFFFFAIRPDRHRQLRQDLAAALQVSSRELVLQTAHLPYPDFAHQGTPASTVIAALRHTDFLPSRTRPAICFIDARPILLSLTWKVCPDALLDTGEIALRFAAGCPARYTFCLLNSRSEELPLGTLVDVAEGEVFTAIYRSFRVTSEDDDRPNSPPDSDEDDDADTGDDSRLRSPSAPVSTSVLAFQSEPADTGGLDVQSALQIVPAAVELSIAPSEPHNVGLPCCNELCDIMSKHSRHSTADPYERCLPLWPHQWWQHEFWQWGWMAHHSSAIYPALTALEAEARRLQLQQPTPVPPGLGLETCTHRNAQVSYTVTAATYNVLTLFDPGAAKGRAVRHTDPGLMVAGKRDLLKAQFLSAGLWLIGMQETRLPTSATLPDRDFLMLNVAADEQGHHGCALWINLHHVFARDGEKAHRVHRDQVVMTHYSPRHLQVHITTPPLNLTVLVLHAPKIQAQGEEAVAAFWQERAEELSQRPPNSECVVLADANSHIGSVTSDSVGAAGAEEENREGFYFQQFLGRAACFVPSTFPDVHKGPHWTWVAPGDNLCTHRLDFVAVPLEWKPFDQHTQVWYDLEAYRRYLRQEEVERQRRLVMVTFAALLLHARGQAFNVTMQACAEAWLAEIDQSLAHALDRLYELTTAVRVAVKRDRVQYLDVLAGNIALQDLKDPKSLYAAVRKAFPKASSSRRMRFQPLPAVRLADGTLAPDAASRRQRWTEFFQAQEAGEQVTPEVYCQLYQRPDCPVLPDGPVFDIHALPTLLDFEQQLHAAKDGKASGPDSIARLSFCAYPCRPLVPFFTRCALTYFDVKAAFYKVIRQSLVRTNEDVSDAGFLAVLYDLGVPDAALPELVRHLRSMETLATAGACQHLQSQVSDLFRGSWFRMDHTGPLVATRRGTRPGDPLADLLFAFAFSAYLRSAEEALRRSDLQTFVPPTASPLPELLPCSVQQGTPTVGCIAWADDYTHLQMNKCPIALCTRVSAATSVLLTHATANGMELTLEKDKTAVLLSSDCPRATGTQAGIRQTAEDALALEVTDEIKQEVRLLPVVASYKHLGSITVANATPAAEIQFRFVQAISVLRHLQKKLFASKDIPLSTRRTLLRSLVVSRFVFSSASIVLQAHTHRRRWSQCFLKLWRGLLPPIQPERQPHSFTVLTVAEAPSPLLAMAQARAVFYRRITREGPDTLCHFLHAHWGEARNASWIGQFLWDIKAVAPFSDATRAFLATSDPVKDLLQVCAEDPQWWPKQVQKAIRAYQADLQVWHSRQQKADHPPAPPAIGEYRCPHCGSTFRLRKHLCTHLARAHQQYSIARHFVPAPYCMACHRYFHTVTRTQHHVKRTPKCLRRLVHVLQPLTLPDILEAEDTDRRRARDLRKGRWGAYEPAQPVAIAYGPRAPTYTEALGDATDETITLDRLQRQYRPSAAVLEWVNAYISGASVEGPRQEATDFWLKRPSQQ